MALTPSNMLPLGTLMPTFELPDANGKVFKNQDVRGRLGTLVMFTCNHCPYVKHIADHVAKETAKFMELGIGVVGINSNDARKYPEDSAAKMIEESKRRGFRFPYLVDADQAVALAFNAACTPEFYLFDASQRLYYRGQWDGSRPGNGVEVNGADVAAAVSALLNGQAAPAKQIPSMGCNIKWLPGNAPGERA